MAAPVNPDAALISDLVATETLRRQALDAQAKKELGVARAAMEARDWETAFKQYRFALAHLSDREDAAQWRKECREGMAEAKYRAAKQALKDGDREHAEIYAKEALAERHPLAAAFLDSLKAESVQEAETDVSEIKHRRNDADYKRDRDLIRKRIRLSAQYLAVADLANALDQVDLVLRSDPYNEEAIALRDRIQRKRDLIIDKEREATRKGMIADVGAAWRPVYAVNSADLKTVSGGTAKSPLGGDGERSVEQSIEKRMKEMMLPAISFRPPATIIDAVDYFRQASKDYDRPEIPVDQRGFNFVLQLGTALKNSGAADADAAKGGNDNAFSSDAGDEGNAAAGDVPVIPNVTASNISLYEALKLVCQVCNPAFKFKVQGSVVMVMPKTMTTDELVTRTYSVVESFVDRMNDASNSLKDSKAGDFSGGGDDEGGESPENQWKAYFEDLGVTWPQNSRIKYIKAVGKLRVTNTEDQLAILEDALNELNVTPSMIEIETRFVEVAQEDLNSLGFEWLLNSDYSFNVGGKLAKALNLKDIRSYNPSSELSMPPARPSIEGGGSPSGDMNDPPATPDLRPAHGIGGPGALAGFRPSGQPTTGGSWARWNDAVNGNYLPTGDMSTMVNRYRGPGRVDANGYVYELARTGKNVGINAIDGSTYQTGMRYLSTEGNHISGQGASVNDKFMRINAFLGNADLSMILHMLSQRSDTDLLSAPKVLTTSGQEAVMKVVTEYIYPTDYDVQLQSSSSGGGNNSGSSQSAILAVVEPQSFTMREVGVILDVTPTLTDDGNLIDLDLNTQVVDEPTWKNYGMRIPFTGNSSLQSFEGIGGIFEGLTGILTTLGTGLSDTLKASFAETAVASATTALDNLTRTSSDNMTYYDAPMEQPFFHVRSVVSKVSVYPGATIVMGGLITEQRKAMDDKVPFLGDLPFVGRLFRSHAEQTTKRNLLIFVTTRLVDTQGRELRSRDEDIVGNEVVAAPSAEN